MGPANCHFWDYEFPTPFSSLGKTDIKSAYDRAIQSILNLHQEAIP